ncbi:hypothetical protein LDL08_26475 [Nonomuraea glycinis]|uniref:Uncharacterized protein n=1 Tax=Nonomuraea glycinis TaxID=2047744 RepID=A0A918E978_9ACTN|nr:hypothetical protein [Nonomuraea glycinis]MCA2179732.1 hypothetical protein [Nonomuraea glycinis]GGP16470.1 hypothetical protein GCM10012278_80390 [Nonomuraea glycinis]
MEVVQMSGEGYRVLLQARSWSQCLRGKGFTWDQIADVLALTHQVSPLRLHRLAHGRTAVDVVSMVNDADPAGTAALRDSRLYDYEGWPETGRRPPARLLAVLARIYETTARSLLPEAVMASYETADRVLLDEADFRHLDANRPTPPNRDSRVTAKTDADRTSAGRTAVDAASCMRLLRAIDIEEADVKRRELLFELALVFGGSRALDLLRILTTEEEERLAGVLRNTWRTDEATVRTFEKLTLQARRADDVSGPATLVPVVNGQRAAVGKLLTRESMAPGLRDRLLDTYAQLSQLTGFLSYDLCEYAAAEQPLLDSLRTAHDLGNPTLIAYAHYWLGRMSADQHRTAAVFDHAFAIQSWATRSPSKLLTPLCQSLFSLAYAAEGDAAASIREHESALASAGAPKADEPAYMYWVSPAVMESRRTTLLVRLNQPRDVIEAAGRYLAEHDSKFKRARDCTRGHGFVLARYAGALAMTKEIPEAAARLTEAANITRRHSSARLTDEINQARARLEPWTNTTYVRHLDETLRSCGLTPTGPGTRA